MVEIWKDIKGFEGKYQVSNLGRVKSLNYKHSGRAGILIPKEQINGYSRVSLYKNGIQKTPTVHRLVAKAFLENPDNLPVINHKDENKQNNCVDNLEWCTIQYNSTYNNAHIKRGKKLAKKVGCYKDGKLIKAYDSIKDTKKDGFHPGHVSSVVIGNYKSHGGYQWKYIE